MTTIAYRDGVIAADTCVSISTEAGGARKFRTEKLFRKRVKVKGRFEEHILGTAGEASPSLVFVDWYGSGKPAPEIFADLGPDFTILIATPRGLFEADAYCRPERVFESFYAIGSGAKAALGAMHAGANARQAVAIACKIDPYSAPPITFMSLQRKPHA